EVTLFAELAPRVVEEFTDRAVGADHSPGTPARIEKGFGPRAGRRAIEVPGGGKDESARRTLHCFDSVTVIDRAGSGPGDLDGVSIGRGPFAEHRTIRQLGLLHGASLRMPCEGTRRGLVSAVGGLNLSSGKVEGGRP